MNPKYNYALAVGISKYSHKFPNANHATPSAELFATTIKNSFNWDEIVLLKDENATESNIFSRLTKFIAADHNLDQFILYFSGHTVMIEGIAYLIPYGVENAKDFIPQYKLLEYLMTIRADKVLFVADCYLSEKQLRETLSNQAFNKKNLCVVAAGDLDKSNDGIPVVNYPITKSLVGGLTKNLPEGISVLKILDSAQYSPHPVVTYFNGTETDDWFINPVIKQPEANKVAESSNKSHTGYSNKPFEASQVNQPTPIYKTKGFYWIAGFCLAIFLFWFIVIHKGFRSKDPFYNSLVKVEGGTFKMGNPKGEKDEQNVHDVTLSTFYICPREVTQEEWYQIMGNNPSRNCEGDTSTICDGFPVEMVSWNDIQKFIAKLKEITGRAYRLPTEAEWEFAARGGNQSKGYKYSGSNTIEDIACYYYNSQRVPVRTGYKKPNELQLYDMSGNVAEWCSDYYQKDYPLEAQSNPQGPANGITRVYRGGACNNYERGCMVSYRCEMDPERRYFNIGFRLVLDEREKVK